MLTFIRIFEIIGVSMFENENQILTPLFCAVLYSLALALFTGAML